MKYRMNKELLEDTKEVFFEKYKNRHETEIHKILKFGGTYLLLSLGLKKEDIEYEYTLKSSKFMQNYFFVDVVGINDKQKIAVECGKVSYHKRGCDGWFIRQHFLPYKRFFDSIIWLPLPYRWNVDKRIIVCKGMLDGKEDEIRVDYIVMNKEHINILGKLMSNRTEVNQDDLDAMIKFSDYINFDFKKI